MKFTLKLKPITKKNHQQILKNKYTGKYFVAPSKQYQDYEEAALWLIPKFRQLPINYPVNVKCLFYMPTKAKCDLTNLLESIDDVMVKAGVLADDNYTIIASHDGSRVLYDKDNPRTEVEITPIKKEAAADVVEVKHGEWVEEYPGIRNIVCPACGKLWNVLDNCTKEFDRCPKCGCVMDGKKEGADNG